MLQIPIHIFEKLNSLLNMDHFIQFVTRSTSFVNFLLIYKNFNDSFFTHIFEPDYYQLLLSINWSYFQILFKIKTRDINCFRYNFLRTFFTDLRCDIGEDKARPEILILQHDNIIWYRYLALSCDNRFSPFGISRMRNPFHHAYSLKP